MVHSGQTNRNHEKTSVPARRCVSMASLLSLALNIYQGFSLLHAVGMLMLDVWLELVLPCHQPAGGVLSAKLDTCRFRRTGNLAPARKRLPCEGRDGFTRACICISLLTVPILPSHRQCWLTGVMLPSDSPSSSSSCCSCCSSSSVSFHPDRHHHPHPQPQHGHRHDRHCHGSAAATNILAISSTLPVALQVWEEEMTFLKEPFDL